MTPNLNNLSLENHQSSHCCSWIKVLWTFYSIQITDLHKRYKYCQNNMIVIEYFWYCAITKLDVYSLLRCFFHKQGCTIHSSMADHGSTFFCFLTQQQNIFVLTCFSHSMFICVDVWIKNILLFCIWNKWYKVLNLGWVSVLGSLDVRP